MYKSGMTSLELQEITPNGGVSFSSPTARPAGVTHNRRWTNTIPNDSYIDFIVNGSSLPSSSSFFGPTTRITPLELAQAPNQMFIPVDSKWQLKKSVELGLKSDVSSLGKISGLKFLKQPESNNQNYR